MLGGRSSWRIFIVKNKYLKQKIKRKIGGRGEYLLCSLFLSLFYMVDGSTYEYKRTAGKARA